MVMHVVMDMQQDLVKYKGFIWFSMQFNNAKLGFLKVYKVMNFWSFNEIMDALERWDDEEWNWCSNIWIRGL